MTIVSTTVSNNVVGAGGGGVRNSGTLTLRNVTVTGNWQSVDGAGDGVGGVATRSPVSLENSIVALNFTISRRLPTRAQHRPSDCGIDPFLTPSGPQFLSLGNNVIGSSADCDVVLQTTDLLADPLFGPFLQDMRPGRAHFPLLPGSPAIDRGNTSTCREADQLGRTRRDQCEIGAVEFRPISTVAANSSITFVPLEETFRFASRVFQDLCPTSFAGTFVFTARLTNPSGRDLTNLVMQVAELSPGNFLQGVDRTFDVGSFLSLSFTRLYFVLSGIDPLDGRLRPQEFVDVPFVVCARGAGAISVLGERL